MEAFKADNLEFTPSSFVSAAHASFVSFTIKIPNTPAAEGVFNRDFARFALRYNTSQPAFKPLRSIDFPNLDRIEQSFLSVENGAHPYGYAKSRLTKHLAVVEQWVEQLTLNEIAPRHPHTNKIALLTVMLRELYNHSQCTRHEAKNLLMQAFALKEDQVDQLLDKAKAVAQQLDVAGAAPARTR